MMEIKQQNILEEGNDKQLQLLYCHQENVHINIISNSCVSGESLSF